MLESATLTKLKEKALEIRKSTIREIATFGSGHIGGSMSIVELLTILYYLEMNVDPSDSLKVDRDRFVCSKGHAGPAVYATLALKGFFPLSWLSTLNQGGTRLPSHCDMTKTPGVDFTGGSLGQGISAAVGIALGQRILGQESRTYCVIGDGESQEGQVYEAAETAGAWHLSNLTLFLDDNGQQLDGYVKDIIPEGNNVARWQSFGFNVIEVDGHNFNELYDAIESAKREKDKPTMVIMHTQKSHGFIPGEGIKGNHSMAFKSEEAEAAIKELEKREAL